MSCLDALPAAAGSRHKRVEFVVGSDIEGVRARRGGLGSHGKPLVEENDVVRRVTRKSPPNLVERRHRHAELRWPDDQDGLRSSFMPLVSATVLSTSNFEEVRPHQFDQGLHIRRRHCLGIWRRLRQHLLHDGKTLLGVIEPSSGTRLKLGHGQRRLLADLRREVGALGRRRRRLHHSQSEQRCEGRDKSKKGHAARRMGGQGEGPRSRGTPPCPECLFGLLGAAAQHRGGLVSFQRDLAQGTSPGQYHHAMRGLRPVSTHSQRYAGKTCQPGRSSRRGSRTSIRHGFARSVFRLGPVDCLFREQLQLSAARALIQATLGEQAHPPSSLHASQVIGSAVAGGKERHVCREKSCVHRCRQA